MKDLIFDDFQRSISDSAFVNKNPWDALSKMSECQNKLTKKLILSVKNNSIDLDSKSREKIEEHLGEYLYNITLLCECIGISLFDVLLSEYKVIDILGKYNLK